MGTERLRQIRPLQVRVHDVGQENVRSDLGDAVQAGPQPRVVEGVRSGVRSQQQLDIGPIQPRVHAKERGAPREHVEQHHDQALRVGYPRQRVLRTVLIEHLHEAEIIDYGADQREVGDEEGVKGGGGWVHLQGFTGQGGIHKPGAQDRWFKAKEIQIACSGRCENQRPNLGDCGNGRST